MLLSFFSDYSSIFMLLSVIILLMQVHNLIKENKTTVAGYIRHIEHLEDQIQEQKREDSNAKVNIALLILGEMKENSYHMVSYLYFFKQRSPETRNLKSAMSETTCISDRIWKALSIDASRFFSKDVMNELVTYYTGISQMRFENEHTLEEVAILTRKELLAYINAVELLEEELQFAFTAARGDAYEINGVKLRINKQNGDLL